MCVSHTRSHTYTHTPPFSSPTHCYCISDRDLREQGHMKTCLGDIGDRETETEVVLLEHDVPYEAFSDNVLA